MNGLKKILCYIVLLLIISLSASRLIAENALVAKVSSKVGLERKIKQDERIEQKQETAAKEKRLAIEKASGRTQPKTKAQWQIEQLDLPEDNTPRFAVKQLVLRGNTLITTEDLLKNMPLVYNASDKRLSKAPSESLYDLRVIHEIINRPNRSRQVSSRTIQGLTQ